MKNLFALSVLLIIFTSSLLSQEPEFEYHKNKEIKTLLGHHREGGAYCAFTTGYSVIDDRKAVLLGARFGLMAGHSLGVGIGATGFINEYHYEPSLERDVFLAGGYGGIYIEPVLLPRFPVHLSFPLLLGGGGISYISKESDMNRNMVGDSEAFLLIEPAAELEFNLTRFLRFSIGASYRFPTSFNIGESSIPDSKIESIEGISYTASFKFGKF
jgi:hypothetical protein